MNQKQDNRISATDARQGEIILRTRARKVIFAVGLIGAALLAVALIFFQHLR